MPADVDDPTIRMRSRYRGVNPIAASTERRLTTNYRKAISV
jgi:hypothetical protein